MFNFSASFPNSRPRRNRQNQAILNLLTQHHLRPSNLILPLFVVDGQNVSESILALPDCFRLSIDLIVAKAKEAYQNQICAIMLFPVVQENLKCETARESHNNHNLICRTIKKIKEEVPESVSIVPLAFPLIAGAGTMTTLLSLKSEYATQNIIVGIILNMIFVYIVLKNTARLEKLFGKSGLNVLRKAFGIILLAIAIKLFRNNTGL
jgi:hypothetical protein